MYLNPWELLVWSFTCHESPFYHPLPISHTVVWIFYTSIRSLFVTYFSPGTPLPSIRYFIFCIDISFNPPPRTGEPTLLLFFVSYFNKWFYVSILIIGWPCLVLSFFLLFNPDRCVPTIPDVSPRFDLGQETQVPFFLYTWDREEGLDCNFT